MKRIVSFLLALVMVWAMLPAAALSAHATEDASREDRISTGNEVGDLAMGLFGEYTEVTALKEDGRPDISAIIEKTRTCIETGVENICEASFSYDGLYCTVDILRKQGNGYAIYEVKSSTREAEIYGVDIAYQKYVLEHCGVTVTGTYLICINSDYIRGEELDITQLFKIVDMADWVELETPLIPSACERGNFLIEGNVLMRYYGRMIQPRIPAGIREIGKGAFAMNSYIQSIVIPEGVRIIAARSFAGCDNLRTVSLPKSLARIGERAFVGTGLNSVEIPKDVYDIGTHAFGSCDKLEEITLPAGLINIPISAFDNCWKIRNIHAPEDWKNQYSDFISAVLEKGTQ